MVFLIALGGWVFAGLIFSIIITVYDEREKKVRLRKAEEVMTSALKSGTRDEYLSACELYFEEIDPEPGLGEDLGTSFVSLGSTSASRTWLRRKSRYMEVKKAEWENTHK